MSRTISIFLFFSLILIAFLFVRLINYSQTDNHQNENQKGNEENLLNFQSWKEFSSKDGRFKVFLPAVPQHVSDQIPDPKTLEPRKYDTFVAPEERGGAFMISLITLTKTPDFKTIETSMQNIVNEMLARNKDNKLKNIQSQEFKNHPALEFSIQNGEMLISGKVFYDKNIFYILSLIGKEDMFNYDDLNFFINSFEINDESSNSKKNK